MKHESPNIRLERLVNALTEDLVQTSDLEIIEAAEDLRMNITQRGTAAFLGIKGLYFPYRPSKFWQLDAADEAGQSPPESPRHEKP